MAEIPEHLLKRSREAKAKAQGETPQAETPAEEPTGEPTGAAEPEPEAAPEPAPSEPAETPAPEAALAVEPVAAATPAVAAEPKMVYAPASRVSGTKPSYRGAKIPGWLYPAYVLVPILVLAMLLAVVQVAGKSETAQGPSVPGQADYAAQCASCHGQDGGGGVGPAFKEITKVFPTAQTHFDWIKADAAKTSGPYGEGGTGNAGKGSTPGAMPAFGSSLSDEQIWGVVVWERSQYGGEPLDKAMADAGLSAGGGAAEGGG